jgi:bacterioferritin
VLFLKGDVELVPAGPVEKIADPEAILMKAMAMEEGSAYFYNQAAIECGAKADAATKQIFERLVGEEEGHFDLYEKQHDNIKRFGLSYLALQSFGAGVPQGAQTAEE